MLAYFGFYGIQGPWLIPSLLILLLSFWAQMRVQSAIARYGAIRSRSGHTGADVARMLLEARGITDVKVERVGGFLSDHYDPTTKTLRLSEVSYDSDSIAAIGVAAHETGHAFQHADGYAWLGMRSALVPLVNLGSTLLPFLMMFTIGSLYFTGFGSHHASSPPGILAYLLVSALGAIALFSLVTLPVEIDASRRALVTIGAAGILEEGEELEGARHVLTAAAWTYVAAAIHAVFELLRWSSILFGRRRND